MQNTTLQTILTSAGHITMPIGVYWLTTIFLAVNWLQLYPTDTLINVDMEIFESRKKNTVD